MKKQKVVAAVLSMAMLSSLALSACNKTDESTTVSLQGWYPPTTQATEPTGTYEQVDVSKPEVKDGIPSYLEDFGDDDVKYVARGDSVQLFEEDAQKANGKVLHVTGRTENWNGVNFPVEEFAGNEIRVQTRVKSKGGKVIISLQFDTMGNTTYSNLYTVMDCTEFVEETTSVNIPKNAENVFVYLESGDTTDIYCDYMYVTVEGDYFDPSQKEEVKIADTSSYESLKDLYKDDFMMGVCVPISTVNNEHTEFKDLIVKEFNSITCENEMKPENILDSQTTLADVAKYNESPAVKFDACKPILDFAKENGIKMRGHTLVWHSQTPDWFFHVDYDTDKPLADRELMLKRLENYMKSVFEFINTNYPDVFYAFDVANECVDDSFNLRKSNWTDTIGEDFLQYAFEYARKYAGKDIKLFYNDYNEYVEKKRDKIIEVLKPIAEAGNLDGMGLQSHISSPVSMENYIGSLKKYADELKVVIHVTELDVNAVRASSNPDYDQGVYYQTLFTELLKAKAEGYKIESVTIWGLTDAGSWRSAETPVLFTGELNAKPAFQGVVNAKKGGELQKPADYVEPPKDGDPFTEDYENDKYTGAARAGVSLKVVEDNPNEGKKCLLVSGASETWDGYTVDASRFLGKKIKYSFAIKTKAAKVSFTADIADLWPHIEDIDTSSGDWVLVEGELDMTGAKWTTEAGEYDVPQLDSLRLYWETTEVTDDYYLDNIHFEVVG